MENLLELRGLTASYLHRARPRSGGGGGLLHGAGGPQPWPDRRERLRQDERGPGHHPRHAAQHAHRTPVKSSSRGGTWSSCSEPAMRELRWRRIAMIPQSSMHSLDPVYRLEDQFYEVLCDQGKMSKGAARGAGGGAVRPGGAGRRAAAQLPPRVQRRHEAARRDRDGAGAATHAGHCGRTGDGPGRDRAGTGARGHPRASGAAGDFRHYDYPRHVSGRADVPRRGGDVRGQGGREPGRSARFSRAPRTPIPWGWRARSRTC